jgi:parvulin-like peptidyl-prolyl isomerase
MKTGSSAAFLLLGMVSQDSRPQEPKKERTTLFEKSETPMPADTYCKVNGYPVLRTEFGDWLQSTKGDQFIRDYVVGKLVRDAAKTVGAEVKPEEIDQRIDKRIEERVLTAFRGRKELFVERELTNYGKTMEQYRKELAWDMETDLLIQKTIKARRLATDADVEREFRRLYGSSGRSLSIRAILIEIESPGITSHKPVEEIQKLTAAAVEAARKKGVLVVKRLQSGATDFASEARASSDDARSKVTGGDIGEYTVTPPEFGEAFDEALQKAKSGQIIGPVRINAGYIVAEITKEVVHDLRKERDTIRKQLTEREATFDEVQVFLGELLHNAKLVR